MALLFLGSFLGRLFYHFPVCTQPSRPPPAKVALGFVGITEDVRIGYSIWLSSGRSAKISASLASLRGYLGNNYVVFLDVARKVEWGAQKRQIP